MKMNNYRSTKIYDGFSTCFRQWKAVDTHCQYLHGYSISLKITYEGDLDGRNWVVDFGRAKRSGVLIDGMNLKDWLKISKIKKIFKVSNFKIEKGILIVNKENFSKVKGFKCFSSGHPIPNRNGLDASIFLENYLGKLEKNDLVLIFISGGGSALAPYPVDGISLEEKIIINKILLESGANIKEINIVTKESIHSLAITQYYNLIG